MAEDWSPRVVVAKSNRERDVRGEGGLERDESADGDLDPSADKGSAPGAAVVNRLQGEITVGSCVCICAERGAAGADADPAP